MKKLNIISTLNIDWKNRDFLYNSLLGFKRIIGYLFANRRGFAFKESMSWFRNTEPFKSFFKVKSVRRIDKIVAEYHIEKLFKDGYMYFKSEKREYWGGTRAKTIPELRKVIFSIKAYYPVIVVTEYHNVWGIPVKTIFSLLKRDKRKIEKAVEYFGGMEILGEEINSLALNRYIENFGFYEDENEVIYYRPTEKLELKDVKYLYVKEGAKQWVTPDEFETMYLENVKELYDRFKYS